MSRGKRIVVKVGTSTLTGADGRVDRAWLADLARQTASLRDRGVDVVVVSSGAISAGVEALGLDARPSELTGLQAAAAVGQVRLIGTYDEVMGSFGVPVAQVLLTRHDTGHRQSYVFACRTLDRLLEMRVVPVVNENDTTAVEEIRFGDNDTLGALVTNLIEADALVILTDQKGLFSADPRKDPNARLIERGEAGDAALEAMAGGAGSPLGSGGMLTKVLAAKRAARSGAHTAIAWGREPDVLLKLFEGTATGTLLAARTAPVAARKQWLADHLKPSGRITLDEGAAKAVTAGGKSLLAIGATAVEGHFERGEVVSVAGPDGREIARGLVNYSSAETARILRKPTSEIEAALGYVAEPELIHRDNLVVL